MIKKSVKKEIDKIIKEVWITDICKAYGNGELLKEASLQCSLYHYLRMRLDSILKENNLYIYPEFYFKELNFFADIVIAEMNMKDNTFHIKDKMTDVAAIIELKYSGGTSQTVENYIKADKTKLKQYVNHLPYECQYYFGVIYETECEWIHWFDKRSTNNWGKGCLTELNAGYLESKMYFGVKSYNDWNIQDDKNQCEIGFMSLA